MHRTRDNDYFEIGTVAFQSLVEDEDSKDVPFVFPEFTYRRLIETPGDRRPARDRAPTRSASCATTGSNMFRAGGEVDWTRDWTLPHGVLASAHRLGAGRCLPGLGESRHPRRHPGPGRARPPPSSCAGRWSATPSGADHVIEPIVQVVYSSAVRDQHDIPNEDSRLPEFDETNLFSLNRFPGVDRLETGLRANLGISYTRYDPAGWSLGVTLGQVLRSESQDDFAEGTGLAGRSSDYVGAVSLDFGWGLQLVNRALFDPASTSAATSSPSPTTATAAACARPTSISPQDDFEPDPRPAAGDQRDRARRPLPGATELGAARPLALRRRDQQQPARRRRDHLRQRVRRVRPFGLASLYLIG